MARVMGWLDRYLRPAERVETSPPVADAVKYTTCYMCACRCGIKVHLQNGQIRYIEGNRDHPVNRGVLCGKGASGIMTQMSPAKLTKPLLRVGERGAGEFREIEWEEALQLAVSWLEPVRRSDPRKLAFFTGRDQSQALTGLWAASFGTPNYAAHGGFCSVNMAAAGVYSTGGSFWEFGEPDWDLSRYMLLFGVAEDHDSNPIKIGLSKLKKRRAKIVSINPVRTGYSAIADEWVAIRPGTDGLFVLALIHELLKADRIDRSYLAHFTSAPWLVLQDPGGAEDGLFLRDSEGRPLAWDSSQQKPAPAQAMDTTPALSGEFTLPDGRRAMPSLELVRRRFLSARFAPEAVAERCGVPAGTIRRVAAEVAHVAFDDPVILERPWTDAYGRRHERMVGRPVAMHAMRGISAHSNGFHTCRALHILQMLIGSIDAPGGWRYKAPYPKPCPPRIRPMGKAEDVRPGEPMPGLPLGFPHGPEDLLVDADGAPLRIDKAFSWDAPLAIHGMLQMVISNAWRGDPYPIDVLFLYMANMAWNSAMSTAETMRMLTDKDPATGEYRIPRIIYADAFRSETVAFADLVLPDTTYLERWDCLSLLDRPIGSAHAAADGIRQPVVEPDRDVRPFQDVLIDLGVRLKLPAFAHPDGAPRYPGGYPDYIANHERRPGIGPLAGWRGEGGTEAGRGAPNPSQLDRYVDNKCFWRHEFSPEESYFKHANRSYLETATRLGFIDCPEPIVLHLYCEPLQRFRLAAEGHGAVQPPERHRSRIAEYFDPLPIWYVPFDEAAIAGDDFPLHAVTQRPMPHYHSWGSQNAWLRQILARNVLYMNRRTGLRLGLGDGDRVWITSRHGRVEGELRLIESCGEHTVWTWNAIGKQAGAWGLKEGAPELTQGFLLNHLISELLPAERGYRQANADPVTGQAAWYDLRVRVEKATDEAGVPQPRPVLHPAAEVKAPDILRYDVARRSSGSRTPKRRAR